MNHSVEEDLGVKRYSQTRRNRQSPTLPSDKQQTKGKTTSKQSLDIYRKHNWPSSHAEFLKEKQKWYKM
jgi:hypothetical protein